MSKVEYYTNTNSVIVYLDKQIQNKSEALNEAAKLILREVIRNEHGIDSSSDR